METAGAKSSANWLPVASVVAFGILMSTLPHGVIWARSGSPLWVTDDDELGVYLATASQTYLNHPTYLTDPVFATPRPTIFPWLTIVPGMLVARVLGLGPLAVSIVWRFLGGASIALGWYAVLHHLVRRQGMAAAGAVVLLAESQLLSGRIFFC